MNHANSSSEGTPPLRLRRKLALAVLGLSAALLAWLLAYVGPATKRAFVEQSELLLNASNQAVRDLAAAQNRGSHDVLVDLIAHTTAARARGLLDLPLEQLATDVAALRHEITAEDSHRTARLQANAATLAGEVLRRTDRDIEARFNQLHEQQMELADAFASDLRALHLWLCAATLAAVLSVLSLALHRVVVRPVERLRAATQRVASGDLGPPEPIRSRDEIGALAADFGAMIEQLRSTRAELDQMHRGLEREVAAKTEHLERALADLQRSHRELAQAEKMASIGTLAGGIAHEFNNLIGGIRGCAAELRSLAASDEQRETLDVILRAADRATTITRQLLRFARPGVERRSEVDLGSLLGDALSLCEPEARRRAVAIQRHGLRSLTVIGDPDALHQVLLNLLTNALQAMPEGGTLTTALASAAGMAQIEIQDTGIGISPADQHRIFEPFFTSRGDDRDPQQRGTGLGLSVSYGIVTAHGGTIAVDSAPRAGTTFRVSLPQQS